MAGVFPEKYELALEDYNHVVDLSPDVATGNYPKIIVFHIFLKDIITELVLMIK
jgi:hypothetical protein